MVPPRDGTALSQEQEEVVTHIIVWSNLEDMVLSERTRHKGPTVCGCGGYGFLLGDGSV
jgi:hypothetical protein